MKDDEMMFARDVKKKMLSNTSGSCVFLFLRAVVYFGPRWEAKPPAVSTMRPTYLAIIFILKPIVSVVHDDSDAKLAKIVNT